MQRHCFAIAAALAAALALAACGKHPAAPAPVRAVKLMTVAAAPAANQQISIKILYSSIKVYRKRFPSRWSSTTSHMPS